MEDGELNFCPGYTYNAIFKMGSSTKAGEVSDKAQLYSVSVWIYSFESHSLIMFSIGGLIQERNV